mmetsp:Transcript_18003/g.40307  ORF Transcript_18003/g.40307 Transcript_18003/m.40307 type:complete len:325 (+) Transcript_18003:306-1280(+)
MERMIDCSMSASRGEKYLESRHRTVHPHQCIHTHAKQSDSITSASARDVAWRCGDVAWRCVYLPRSLHKSGRPNEIGPGSQRRIPPKPLIRNDIRNDPTPNPRPYRKSAARAIGSRHWRTAPQNPVRLQVSVVTAQQITSSAKKHLGLGGEFEPGARADLGVERDLFRLVGNTENHLQLLALLLQHLGFPPAVVFAHLNQLAQHRAPILRHSRSYSYPLTLHALLALRFAFLINESGERDGVLIGFFLLGHGRRGPRVLEPLHDVFHLDCGVDLNGVATINRSLLFLLKLVNEVVIHDIRLGLPRHLARLALLLPLNVVLQPTL